MTTVRIQTGSVEEIEVYVTDRAGIPLVGATDCYVRIRRISDGLFLDWDDMTFKGIGWTTLDKGLSELDPTYAPGLYGVTGGLNTSAVTNANANDSYTVFPLQTPGTDAHLPGPGIIQVGKWLDYVDAVISTRATQAQILSDATPFSGADIADIKTASQAVDSRLPTDPADESNQLAQHAVTQGAIAALHNISALDVDTQLSGTHGAGTWGSSGSGITPAQVSAAVWDEPRSTHSVASSFGESVRLTATGLQADAATEIRDAILDDGTRFSGAKIARLDVAVSTRSVSGDAMDLIAGAVDANAVDVTAVAEIAGGVWDEALAGHTGAGTAGQAQGRLDAAISTRAAPGAQMDLVNDAVDAASLATSAATEIAGKVWDEALSGHTGVGTAGEAEARLDVAVSTRSAPGAQMALTPATRVLVVDEVWDEVLATHLGTGTTGKALQDAGATTSPTLIAAAVWDEAAAGHTTVGSMGQLENRLDVPVSTRAEPGDPMDLQAGAVNATSVASSGATKIRDTILSDATPFPGARIDAAITSRAAPGAAMDLVANAVDSSALDATGVSKLADGVWDELLAGHLTVGSAGKVLNDGSNPAAIAGAVWDEPLASHVDPGSAGEAEGRLDAQVTSRTAPGDAMALVTDALDAAAVATTGANKIRDAILSDGIPFEGARIDATITSRAAPGSAMDLVDNAVDAGAVATAGAQKIAGRVWDENMAGHGAVGTAGAFLDRLDVAVSTRTTPGDAMALTSPAGEVVAGKVWDVPIASHVTPGTTGKTLSDAATAVTPVEIAQAVWDEPRAGHVTPGTMGEAQEQSSEVAGQVAKIDQAATLAPSVAVPGSLLDRLTNKSGSQTYDQATDSLEGIRDRIG